MGLFLWCEKNLRIMNFFSGRLTKEVWHEHESND